MADEVFGEDARQAEAAIEKHVRGEFERIWTEVTEQPIDDYRIIIWGSTIQDTDDDPNDLDLIFEYTGRTIQPEQEKSIEGWLRDSVGRINGVRLDPLVSHYTEVRDIIPNSRVDKVYSIDENGWVEY